MLCLLLDSYHLHAFCKYLNDSMPDTVLVFKRPASDFAFDIYLIPFMKILLGCFGNTTPYYDIMPFGTFGNLCAIWQSLCALGRGKRELADGDTALKISDIGILSEMS